MAPMKKNIGRPSLGAREAFTVKLPRHEAQKLRAILDMESTSAQSYMERVLSVHLSTIDNSVITNGQEELPLDQAS
ncbi:hypothetical protein [Pseudarthrobacter sp. J47]|uniref:hypothetical protein n=1 Tax=Pseudarthrobacter sp. J47 TaxID=3116482 RepID=UPI002E812E0C|nr:hypothetical protein [Pseudarthrobacter sp. J47]MEE2524499.1 hypothetical protein [Pseudarthrobacter sp. J47]